MAGKGEWSKSKSEREDGDDMEWRNENGGGGLQERNITHSPPLQIVVLKLERDTL